MSNTARNRRKRRRKAASRRKVANHRTGANHRTVANHRTGANRPTGANRREVALASGVEFSLRAEHGPAHTTDLLVDTPASYPPKRAIESYEALAAAEQMTPYGYALLAQCYDRTPYDDAPLPLDFDESSTEHVCQRLREAGLEVGEASFRQVAADHTSAWALACALWPDADPRTRNIAGVIAAELWHRWLPDRPCPETVGRLFLSAQSLTCEGEIERASDAYLQMWDAWAAQLPDRRATLDELIQAAATHWKPEEALSALAVHFAETWWDDPARRDQAIAALEQISARVDLPWKRAGRSVTCALADLLMQTDRQAEGIALHREVLAQHHDESWSYESLVGYHSHPNGGLLDRLEAIELLKASVLAGAAEPARAQLEIEQLERSVV